MVHHVKIQFVLGLFKYYVSKQGGWVCLNAYFSFGCIRLCGSGRLIKIGYESYKIACSIGGKSDMGWWVGQKMA